MRVTLVRSDAQNCGTDCPRWLALQGKIGLETPALLRRALGLAGRTPLAILIDSPGGAVEPALAMGRLIRSRGLMVAVAGTALSACAPDDRSCLAQQKAGIRLGGVSFAPAGCASACTLILASGTRRFVGPGAFVGVHQMILKKRFTKVMNTFHILRRMVDGRPVEVSRTLVASRPIESHIVTSKAPEQLYDEVAEFLHQMGIGPDLVPLMRATPPSSIHWMSASEIASTHMATDSGGGRALLARLEPEAVSAAAPVVDGAVSFGPADLTLKPPKQPLVVEDGAVTWALTGGSAGAVLRGDLTIAGRRLRGQVTLAQNGNGSSIGELALRIRFTTLLVPEDRPILSVGAPRLSGGKDDPGLQLGASNLPIVDEDFVAIVPKDRREAVLKVLQDRATLKVPVTLKDHTSAELSVDIGGSGHAAVEQWLRQCCGRPPSTPVLAEAGQVSPPGPEPKPVSWTLDGTPIFTLRRPGSPDATEPGTLTWFLIATPETVGGPGTTALMSAIEVPAARLRLSLQAGASPPGQAGDLMLDIQIVAGDETAFGPVTSLSIPPAWTPDSHILLIADTIEKLRFGGYRVALSLPFDGEIGPQMRVELGDAAGRHATLLLSIPGPVNALLGAAARKVSRVAG